MQLNYCWIRYFFVRTSDELRLSRADRRAQGRMPFMPIMKDKPVMPCDHPEGVVDGYDRPLYLFEDVLHPSVFHKCASTFASRRVLPQVRVPSRHLRFSKEYYVYLYASTFALSMCVSVIFLNSSPSFSVFGILCLSLLQCSVAFAGCDLLRTAADCTWLMPEELPHRELLIADQKLLDCETVSHLLSTTPGIAHGNSTA